MKLYQLSLVPCFILVCVGMSSQFPHSDDQVKPFDMPEDNLGEPFGPADYHFASLLNVAPPSKMQDPIELAGLYEGDILLTEEDIALHFNSSSAESERNANKNEALKWPDGVVPYTIASNFNAQERLVIANSFLEYHQQTCLRFKPRTTEANYIHIWKGSGCSSRVGMVGGEQKVSLGNGCVYPGIAMHELMHAIGFWHEQSRGDRDDHVIIHWDNIQQGMKFNFQKLGWDTIQSLGVSYDTTSIMHYGPYAFAKDRSKPTMSPKPKDPYMGQREGFTQKDLLKINRLYRCNENGEPAGAQNTTPQSLPGCVDKDKYCKIWAQRGECEKNPKWMKANCQVSCKTCGNN